MASKRVLWPVLIFLLIVSSIYLQQSQVTVTARSTAVDILAPLQDLLGRLSGVSAGFDWPYKDSRGLQQENQKLQQMVDDLRRQNVELWEAVARQQKEMEDKGFEKSNPQWSYLSARVLAWDPSNLVRTVVLNRGRVDGVAQGMVVVSSSGLVGKVVELSDRWSKVLLVIDPRSSANGMLQGPEDRPKGILQGRTDGLLQMKYLPAESNPRKGDVIVTSGLGGAFPTGIFIGWVMEVSYSDGQMFHEALVRPAANLSNLDDVMIITNFMPLSLD